MEIGEEVAAAAESSLEDRSVKCGIKLVDVHGKPLREVTVEFSSGERKRTDANGFIEGPFPSRDKVKLPDGRRVIFGGFELYQPLIFDPGAIGPGPGDGALGHRNDVFDETDEPPDDDPWGW
jgi:hypothetical protein